jgi:rhamnosyltransferase subunit B
MKIIILALGTAGDVNPLIGIAKLLVGFGFEDLTFLTNSYFKSSLESAGLNFISVGESEIYKKNYHSGVFQKDRSFEAIDFQQKTFYIPQILPAYNYIAECTLSNSNLLIITNGEMDGARMAAEKFNIPVVQIVATPHVLRSFVEPTYPLSELFSDVKYSAHKELYVRSYFEGLDRAIFSPGRFGEQINKIRDLLELPILKKYALNQQHEKANLLIGLFPDWYAMQPEDWPKNIILTNFPMFDPNSSINKHKLDNFLLNNSRPIVFSMGSALQYSSNFFNESLIACKELGLPGVFVANDIEKIGIKFPEDILPLNYIDFKYLFDRSLLAVHHGGIGTVSQAIRAGIPQLVTAITWDQPDNGFRVDKLKLGKYIFPFENYSSIWATDAINEVLSNNEIKISCEQYSGMIKAKNGIEMAAAIIREKFLAGKIKF